MKIPIVLGIDIGGTYTSFGLVTREGKIQSKDELPMNSLPVAEDLVQNVCLKVQNLLSQIGPGYFLEGVGIGAPNGNYFKGTIEFAPNLNWKGIIPLAEMFQKALSIPSVLTNDANAAALGEMYFGGAVGMKDFLFITLGTGLGSGIVVNGNLVYGHDGFAGELGHTILIPEGRQCGCGRRGCLEQYCSATGIVKTFLENAGNKSTKPEMKTSQELNAKKIFELAKNGDENAIQAFNETGDLLGLALANSVAYTSPEAIFLFGGLAQAGDLLFHPVKNSFEKNLLDIYKGKVKIIPSSLPENNAAILGAASLIWKELDKQ